MTQQRTQQKCIPKQQHEEEEQEEKASITMTQLVKHDDDNNEQEEGIHKLGEETDQKNEEKSQKLTLSGEGEKEEEKTDEQQQPQQQQQDELEQRVSVVAARNQFRKLFLISRFYAWARNFRRTDPRFRILEFFYNVEENGCTQMCQVIDDGNNNNKNQNNNNNNNSQDDRCKEGCFLPIYKKEGFLHRPSFVQYPANCFHRAGVFTVWRPCSRDAINKMMTGQGVGKGLDIKGKSAKCGKLSGFVPFLQIHKNEHKSRVHTLAKDARVRLFFKSEASRTKVLEILKPLAVEMIQGYAKAQKVLKDDDQGKCAATPEEREEALSRYMWDMPDPSILLLDDYVSKGLYGLDLPQRLLWEGYIMRQSIEREPGSCYDGGRPSVPEFQDANLKPLKKKFVPGNPRPVLLQYEEDPEEVMKPHTLLMAYEESDLQRVAPVISDFDCFLVGTRRVAFEQELSSEQKKILKWQVEKIQQILSKGETPDVWTMRWMEMLKDEMEQNDYVMPDAPKYGFGDPTSYNVMRHAVDRLTKDGCVRHGAECFNYTFPQDLDDSFLILSSLGDQFAMEVDREGLVEYLSEMASAGYIFPLNPKWILCDLGFKLVYDKLMANPTANAKAAMNTWFPPETGIREMIEKIHADHPDGYQQIERSFRIKQKRYSPLRTCIRDGYQMDSRTAMDLAMLELNHHKVVLKYQAASHAILASLRIYTRNRTSLLMDPKEG